MRLIPPKGPQCIATCLRFSSSGSDLFSSSAWPWPVAAGHRRRPRPNPRQVRHRRPGSPSGSIQMAGSVSDAAWRPLAGARVEVVDGPQAGLSTTTDGSGEFRLSGNFDDTTHFRATKDGHVASTWPLPAACGPCNPDWWIHFSLEALAPHPNLAGDYTLTVIANSTCTSVPEAFRTRTFDATLTLHSDPEFPSNSRFEVSLGSPPFLDQYRSFQIGVAGDYVGGFVGDLHGTPGLAARIATNTYIGIGGSVAGTVEMSGATISASIDGFIDYCERQSEMGSELRLRRQSAMQLDRSSADSEAKMTSKTVCPARDGSGPRRLRRPLRTAHRALAARTGARHAATQRADERDSLPVHRIDNRVFHDGPPRRAGSDRAVQHRRRAHLDRR